MMKYAVLFHLVMNTFMYTNKRVLTPADYTREMHYRPIGGKPLGKRFDNEPNMMVLMLTVVVIIIYLIYKFIILAIIQCC